MASTNLPTQKITHGIILRTSIAHNGRYAYFPFPRCLPTEIGNSIDTMFSDSLAKAPHFPHITILDCVSPNILYQNHDTSSNSYHVYSLFNCSHSVFSFPYPLTQVNAAIVLLDQTRFKVLVACINEHPNHLCAEGDDRIKPLVFYLYSSESKDWSLISIDYALTSDHLLSSRRKPIHTGEDIVHLDLTNHHLVMFCYWNDKVEVIQKVISNRDLKKGSISELNETARYGECKGQLCCARFNPIKVRIEVYNWIRRAGWKLAVAGRTQSCRGKVLGIHPHEKSCVLLRSTDKDEVLIVDIAKDLSWVVIGGKGSNCGAMCFLREMNEALEAMTLGDSTKLQHSSCGVLHPHENVEGPEGEFFAISLDRTSSFLPPKNVLELSR